MSASDAERVIGPVLQARARLYAAMELGLAKELGDRNKVTAPNLASLMFYAEEGGERRCCSPETATSATS